MSNDRMHAVALPPVPGQRFPLTHARIAALLGLTIAFLAALGAPTGVAVAHTSFESSTPADGDTLDTPIDVVTITFSGVATPTGDGFVALDGDGTVRPPDDVATVDDRTFQLRFDPPLAGQVGVRWTVRAADAHVIEGSFSFTVTAPPPAGGTEPATPTPPGSTRPESVDSATTVPAAASMT